MIVIRAYRVSAVHRETGNRIVFYVRARSYGAALKHVKAARPAYHKFNVTEYEPT